MAHITEDDCYVCKKKTVFINGECRVCSEKKFKEKERMWEAQDLETKITDLRHRIERLELPPARY